MKKLYPTCPECGTTIPKFINLVELHTCTSTNSYVKDNINSLIDSSPVVITAKIQTEGRGRSNRKWYSSDEGGLYFSLLLKTRNRENFKFFSIVAGIATVETIKNITGLDAMLKWPNDIEINEKKAGGILIENQIFNNYLLSVVGIGLNVNNNISNIPSETPKKAISVSSVSGNKENLREIMENLVGTFLYFSKLLDEGKSDYILNIYSSSLKHRAGDPITFHDGTSIVKGNFVRLDGKGGLVLKLPTGAEKTFFSGEIF